MHIIKIIGILYLTWGKARKYLVRSILKGLFKKKGKNIIFNPNDYFSFHTISLGNDVFIGSGAYFSSTHSYIEIGNKVMFGPNVLLLGGNHNTSILGKYMFDVKEKTEETDAPIIIEDDCWIGANVIILKGVTVGTGSIIAAGAIVNKDIEPYTVVGGIPAKKIRPRFSKIELQQHISLLKR